jgi:type III pantothenate kinase
MLLSLDVGNSHIFAGLFDVENQLNTSFRFTSKGNTSDEFGIFLRQILREHGVDAHQITSIGISSVVPHLDDSLRSACRKYFSINPLFIQHTIHSKLKINFPNAAELGADRIANAIAAIEMFPNENLIILDFGTAVTFCAIDNNHHYLGGTIFPGMRLLAESLGNNTAKLPTVQITTKQKAVSTTTVDSIQSGIFFGTLGACKELISRFKLEQFSGQPVRIVATGGFSSLFNGYGVYDNYIPDLVLHGIRISVRDNRGADLLERQKIKITHS